MRNLLPLGKDEQLERFLGFGTSVVRATDSQPLLSSFEYGRVENSLQMTRK